MFGYDLNQIIEGHIKEALNLENDLYNKRMPICRQCPLYTKDNILGALCDNKKGYNPQTGEINNLPEPGFVRGCGCRLEAKNRVKKSKCVLNKW